MCVLVCSLGSSPLLAQDAGLPPPPSAAEAPAVAGPEAQGAPAEAAAPVEAPPVIDGPSQLPAPIAPPPSPAPEPASPSALRERGTGTLRGQIKAADLEAPLAGATVYVRGEPFQTPTDGEGRFSLDLPAATYQIYVIASGYSTMMVSKVEVRPGKTAALNLDLHPGSEQLDEFVITGSHVEGGIASLIAERRKSSAVADVIGAEQMARSGDTNAASALSRVTGITVIDGRFVIVRGMGERYSSMTLNSLQVASPDPTRRVVPLDLFPAGVIESVMVQKSYSPDLPGEFGGGLVQLRSREYPHEFQLSLNVGTGGNTNSIFRNRLTDEGARFDLLGVDDGSRELPESFDDPRGKITLSTFDPNVGYSEDEIKQFGKDLPKSYDTHNERTPPDLTLGANIGDEYRLRYAKIGFVLAGGYRSEFRSVRDAINRFYPVGSEIPTEDALVDTHRRQISLSGFLDWGVEFSKRQKLKFTTMLLRQSDDNTQYRTIQTNAMDGGNHRTIIQWVERQVLLQQVLGNHVFGAHDFQVDWRYAFGRATRIEPNRREYIYRQNEEGVYQLDSGGNSNESAFSDLTDYTHEGALDLSQPFRVWRGLKAKAKAGGLVYRRDRDAASRRFGFTVPARGIDRTQSPDNILNDENVDADLIRLQEVTQPTDAYDAWMQIEAGYGMLELPVATSLDLMGGARVEHARIEASTFDMFTGRPAASSKLDNLDVLPAATLTWRFAESFQLRGGYGRTLNRPDFRELSPSRYFDLEANLLLVGNPDVKRALINNYDARIEWYFTPDEVFSVGSFVKDFTDPIETYQVAAAEEIYSVQNVDHALSYGFEFEARKHFGFLTKLLDPLYLASNVSIIRSRVEVELGQGEIYERPLQGQSPWVVNVQLGWDDSGEGGTGTSASLLYNCAGRRIRVVGDPDIDPSMSQGDTYEEPINRLDFVVAQNLKHGFKLGFRARNLLNPVEKWMRDGQLVRSQRRGADLQLSLAWSY